MDQVASVRSFNRSVTQRLGLLEAGYLDRGRPLGASRVLWELSPDGTDLRELRDRLSLDSGYLSRLLRTLESENLVTVDADPRDGRLRVATPTAAGLQERAELDRLADDRASGILQPLSQEQRARLVEAMGEVERLLIAAQIRVGLEPPESDDVRGAFAQFYRELDTRFEGGFSPGNTLHVGDDEFTPPHGGVLLARLDGQVVGCGAVRLTAPDTAHLKRMWVSPAVRGLGLGRRLMTELETLAAALGARRVQLETNHTLHEAIAMYRTSGYEAIPRFNEERYADHWFEKPLR